MSEVELFAKAIVITNPAERLGFLDRACEGKPEVRERMDQLLDAHLRSNPWLDSSKSSDSASNYPQAEAAGMLIAGRYKLLEQIGEGGMGAVYLADQMEPVQRQVALKIIKPGLESPQILMRFEAERQALALLDHPNISRLLDAGTTSSGQPYFVMEWVDGLSVTEFCDTHRLHSRARLELLISACQAMQHAHQKGLIHRDIKPSNILVAEVDGKPVPKVIDFSVAKAMGGGMLPHPGYQS